MNYPVIDIVETGIRVWEENADETLYGRVFLALVSFLRRSGWRVVFDQTVRGPQSFRRKYRLATKGELFASLNVMGRVLEIEMWQERYNVENPNGARYDFRKRSRMPPLLLRRCDLETIRIVEWLAERTGYQADDRRYLRESSVDERIMRDVRGSGHYRDELGHAPFYGDRNRQSADGGLIEHGQRCWCRDRKGRILRGIAYYRLNSNWWMRLSKDEALSVSAHDIYLRQPAALRVRRNDDLRASRLRSELKKAVEAEDYRRAHLLKALRDATVAKVEQARKPKEAA